MNKPKEYYVSPTEKKTLDTIICTNCPGGSTLIAIDNYHVIVCDNCNRTVGILAYTVPETPPITQSAS